MDNKRLRTGEDSYSTQRSVGRIINNSNESIYYDTNLSVAISNDSGVTPEGVHGRYARFKDTRSQNLIPETGAYTLSLVRGSITTDCFPLFVPLIRPSTPGSPNPVLENGSYEWETTLQPGLALTWTGPVYAESLTGTGVLPSAEAFIASWPTYGFISVYSNNGDVASINLGAISSNPDVGIFAACSRLTNAFSAVGVPISVDYSGQFYSFTNSSTTITYYLDFSFPSGFAQFNQGGSVIPRTGLLQACKLLGFIPGQVFIVPTTSVITYAPRPFQMGLRTTLDLYSYKNVRWTPEDTSATPPANADDISRFEGTYFDCYTYEHLLNECINPTFRRLIYDQWDADITPGVTPTPLTEQCLQRQLTTLTRANCAAVTFWNAGTSYNVGNSVIFEGRAYYCQRAILANQQASGLEPTTNGVLNPDWVDCGPSIMSTWSPLRSYVVGDVVTYAFGANARPTSYICSLNTGPVPVFPSLTPPPTIRMTGVSFGGSVSGTTALPTWTFLMAGGAGASFGAFTTRQYQVLTATNIANTFTPIESGTFVGTETSFTYTGTTVPNDYYMLEITVTSNSGADRVRAAIRSTAGSLVNYPLYYSPTFTFQGGMGSALANPRWTVSYSGETTNLTWAVSSGPTPLTGTTLLNFGSGVLSPIQWAGDTQPNLYYIMTVGPPINVNWRFEFLSSRLNSPIISAFATNVSAATNLTSSATQVVKPNIPAIGTIAPTITFNPETQLFTMNLDSYGFGGTSASNAYDGYYGYDDSPSPPTINQQISNSALNDQARDSWGLSGTNIVSPAYSTFRHPGGIVYDERMVVESDDYFNQLFGNWPMLRLNYIDPKTSLVTSYVRYTYQASTACLTIPTPVPYVNPTISTTGYLPLTRVAGNQPFLYAFPQNYPSIGLVWNPIDTIVITTNGVPCVANQTVPPKVLGDINQGQNISATSRNIIAEFVVKDGNVEAGQEYRSQIVFEPNFETRIDLLRGTPNFNSFDFEVFMRMKSTGLARRVTLSNGGSLYIRWHFQLKSMG
jgi:hypothetical protein